jgi:hypothetical protein
LNEEIDLDRVRMLGNDSRVAIAHSTRPEVDFRQQIVYLCVQLAGIVEKTLMVRSV